MSTSRIPTKAIKAMYILSILVFLSSCASIVKLSYELFQLEETTIVTDAYTAPADIVLSDTLVERTLAANY